MASCPASDAMTWVWGHTLQGHELDVCSAKLAGTDVSLLFIFFFILFFFKVMVGAGLLLCSAACLTFLNRPWPGRWQCCGKQCHDRMKAGRHVMPGFCQCRWLATCALLQVHGVQLALLVIMTY